GRWAARVETGRMLNGPELAKGRVKPAWPLASSVTRAPPRPFTKNVTVPVGMLLPAGPRTVAVNVTACPTRAEGADGARAVVVAVRVAGGFTCSVRDCELAAKVASPL